MGTDSTTPPHQNRARPAGCTIQLPRGEMDPPNIQIVLHDARAALADARSRRPICDVDIATSQQSVYAYEDSEVLAKAKLAVASAAIERSTSLQARRMTAARQMASCRSVLAVASSTSSPSITRPMRRCGTTTRQSAGCIRPQQGRRSQKQPRSNRGRGQQQPPPRQVSNSDPGGRLR